MSMMLAKLRDYAARNPERIAIDSIFEAPVSYARLAELTGEMAADLGRKHAGKQPAALRLDHGLREAVLELALLETGIPVLSLPGFFTSDQIRHALAASGAQALFQSETAEHHPAEPVPLPAGTARISFTSGSTGTPRGVCLSADHMLTVAASVVDAIGAAHAGRHLALLPSGILLETIAGFFASMLAGGTYVCPPQAMVGMADPFRPDYSAMLRAIADWRISSLILVPEYLAGIVQAMEASGIRLPLLTLVAVGGSRTPPVLLERAYALGLPVRQGYGLTECGSVISLQSAAGTSLGSVGIPLPHMEVSIADDGEVIVDGPLYLGTIGAPRKPGPLATGDLGRIDADGALWIEGRKSNLIVTSFGRNISPEWVEEALLAQPAIAQAMVYGDGLPAPRALLSPAHPDADFAAAVAAANAALPAYARVSEWQETAHFTPDNGHLTGNGRLRRDAITAAYLGTEPAFFTRLEAATTRQRMRFLAVPQVQAGLTGEIGRDAYISYLTQAYHHVRHTVPLMQAARARLAHRPELIAAFDDYIAEETGHEEWIISDIAAAGGDADAARHSRPAAATQAMVDHAYRRIQNGNPVGFFGMVYVLESVSVALAQRGANAVAERLDLPPEAFTYLTSHGALDQDHIAFFAGLVNALSAEEDRAAITGMAQEMFGLFGSVFASIELEETYAPA